MHLLKGMLGYKCKEELNMNSIQQVKWFVRAAKAVGEAGYKISNIYIAEASFKKGKYDYAMFIAKGHTFDQVHELTVRLDQKTAEISDIKVINQ